MHWKLLALEGREDLRDAALELAELVRRGEAEDRGGAAGLEERGRSCRSRRTGEPKASQDSSFSLVIAPAP